MVGFIEGVLLGLADGSKVGKDVGSIEGTTVGFLLAGISVGDLVGFRLRVYVGDLVGATDGLDVNGADGSLLGFSLGDLLGLIDGFLVGPRLGLIVDGDLVGDPGQNREHNPDPTSQFAFGLQQLFALPQPVPVFVKTQLFTV